MRSDCTHLMFIDSDIGFNANDVIAMLAMSDGHPDLNNGEPHDIMCGPYPKKCISWEKIKQAVDTGIADEDAEVLSKFVGDYVFNPVAGQNTIKLDQPAEVLEGGTGFMMIRRATFERFNEAYPNMLYKPDHVRTAEFDGSREIMAYFDCVIEPKNKRYLSEDYMFCQWANKAGLKIWMCPWMRTTHQGMYMFGGSLMDLAQIGAAATADPSQIGGKKKFLQLPTKKK